MRITIVGFPLCGKSTLFTAITGVKIAPGTAAEQLAAVKVPEPRLDWLEEVYKPKKRTEAIVEFVDLPGSADGENEHASLTRHMPSIRQADALLIVLRGFHSDAVPAHGGSVDAARDLKVLRDEMLLADLVSCDNRVDKLEKGMAKPTKDRDAQKAELALLQRCRAALEKEQPLTSVVQPGDEEKMLRSFGFMTQKKSVTAINVGEADVRKEAAFTDPMACATFNVCATLESDLIQMEPADRPEFMKEYGIGALARDRIIRACYDALGMIAFLTAGEDEVRAWPIPRGATAVEAAGRIHSDLARGFIRAETVSYEDLRTAGSMRDAKAAGKVRQEQKPYIVQDGDIMNIKHSG